MQNQAADSLRFRGIVESRQQASELLQQPGDAVLVKRGRPRMLLLSCPCGCGDQFPVNLDPKAGPAWHLYVNTRHGLSLYPSVWRTSDCKSHYVIWRDKIWLSDRYDDEFDFWLSSDDNGNLTDAVRTVLPRNGVLDFFEIAKTLEAIPWDVLIVCRHLVKSGEAIEGKGKDRGCFGYKDASGENVPYHQAP